MDKYAEMREALEAGPSLGEWSQEGLEVYADGCEFHPIAVCVRHPSCEPQEVCEANAKYIAACYPEAIRALLAERDALRKTQQWQPIETAPKYGGWIMAYRPPIEDVQMDTIVMVSWQPFDDEGSAWMWPDALYDLTTEAGRTAALRLIEQGSLYWDESFTHWMPLPEAPSAALTQEQGGSDA